MFADGLGQARITKHLQTLKLLYKLTPWNVQHVSRREITGILAFIERSEWTAWTKHDYKLTLRKYLVFADHKELADLIRLPKVHTYKLPEELLTPEDIAELLAVTRSDQDQALIFLLWDSGARIGELLALQRKHVTFDSLGAVLIVNGKTGMRRIRVIEAAAALDKWISINSLRSEDLIFDNSYQAYAKRLKALARRADIRKRVYPHLFRHSRATYLAGYLTEAQLCAMFGWTISSATPRIYVHLNGQDLDAALANVPPILNTHTGKSRPPSCEYGVFTQFSH